MPQMIRDWPHAPAHRLTASGAYIVTSGTYHGIPIFNSTDRLTYLTNSILDLTEKYNCSLQTWAIFNNHYHLILETAEPASLKTLVRHIHGRTSRYANVLDSTAIYKVWFQYWVTRLSYPKSFLSRLHRPCKRRSTLVRAPDCLPVVLRGI